MSEEPSYHWIRSAIAAGGVLTVKSPLPGKAWFLASMKWKGELPVRGKTALDILHALEDLDSALCQDAINEMVRKGVV